MTLTNLFEIALKEDNKIAIFEYALHLYCAINNTGIYNQAGDLVADYAGREAATMIANLREMGSDLDFAWMTTRDDLTYIYEDLKGLGYTVGKHPALDPNYTYYPTSKAYVLTSEKSLGI